MYCRKCGKEVKPEARFCPQCGADLSVQQGMPGSAGQSGGPAPRPENSQNAGGQNRAAGGPAPCPENSQNAGRQNRAEGGPAPRPENSQNAGRQNRAAGGPAPRPENSRNAGARRPAPSPAYSPQQIPEEYKPISMWGYFGYEILFSIPVVGFILLIVFSITAKNQNLKNFARSYFCYLIIVAVVILIIVTTLFAGAGAARSGSL